MTYPKPPEFVAQGDRVLVVGVATGKIKATNKTFKDDWVFDITVRDGKLTKIREYIDTQALARASEMPRAPGFNPSEIGGGCDAARIADQIEHRYAHPAGKASEVCWAMYVQAPPPPVSRSELPFPAPGDRPM